MKLYFVYICNNISTLLIKFYSYEKNFFIISAVIHLCDIRKW